MFRNFDPLALGIWGHESEVIELALTHGFEGMEFDIEDFAGRAKTHDLDYALRLIRSANIRLGTFRLPLDWDVEDAVFKQSLEQLEEYARLAAAAGCTRCTAVVQPAGDKRPYHENFDFHRFRFTAICKVLEPHGIRLGVGFRAAPELRESQAFQFIHDFDALSLLLKVVDSENVGFVIDTWNCHVAGTSLDELRKLSADKIVAVTVADLPSGEAPESVTEQMRTLPSDDGAVDNVGFLKVLAELEYDGPVTPKPNRKALGTARREALVKRAAESLKQIWEAAGLPVERDLTTAIGKRL